MDPAWLAIAIEESRSEVFCHPGHVEAGQALVDDLGLSEAVTVHGSPYVPLGQAYMLDSNAMQATLNEAFDTRPGTWRWT